ncbi:MAG: hypothetical protein WBK91_04000 [Alphaproteobacteria bacterium]
MFDVTWQQLVAEYGSQRAAVILLAFERHWRIMSPVDSSRAERWSAVMMVAREELVEWERK